MTPDPVFRIVRELLLIDNRPPKLLAEATGLTPATIRRIRDGDTAFIRSSTCAAIAKATNRTIVTRPRR